MNRTLFALVLIALFTAAAAPPVAPVKPVVDDYFGVNVTDPYRYMENLSDPIVKDWLKGQADYTESVLAKIPGRQQMLDDIVKYVNGAPATVTDLQRLASGRYFFLKTLTGQSLAKLYMRQDPAGQDVLLVDTDKFTGPHGEPPAINYFEPSPDGKFVAYGISQGGSEAAAMHLMDIDGHKDFPEVIDRAEFGGVAWLPDNQSFVYNRLQKLGEKSTPLDKFKYSKVYLHRLGDSPDKDTIVFGAGMWPDVSVLEDDIPFIQTQPGCPYVIGAIEHGVQNENTVYVAPLDSLGKPDIKWAKLCDVDADVTEFAIKGSDVYLVTHKDAPRFKIMHTTLDQAGKADFQPFLPQTPGVLKGITAAADAIYIGELDDGVYHIVRAPYDGSAAAKIPLPFEGAVEIYPADPRSDGIAFELTSWTKGPRIMEYDPKSGHATLTDIRPAGPYDNLEDLTSLEVKAPSYDGTLIPLSIISKKGLKLDGKNPTIVWAYGAYGITEDPGFGGSWLAWIRHGGIFAVAHVRGGGERGEEWHKAGYKLTKPNTWRDTIACSEYLIDQKYTSTPYLGVMGGSAGGITVGRAITARPDLFAAAVPMAPVVNPLRAEYSPNGPPNIPEFGSSTTQEGFEDLYAMDAYQHVRDGVAYPAVLLTTGINDPRVSPWEPAKMAARLQAATSSGKPILLRVDYQGGHGIGASRKQREEEYADEFSFFLWQFGDPGFQPGFSSPNLHADIEYSHPDGQSEKLDAYVPEGPGPFPIAILVHGGGWGSGEKAREFAVMFQPLSDANFTWFSIDYRLSSTAPWPACYQDMQSAIRWVKAHAAEYKGDPKRIALIGYSAGGELVTLAAAQAAADDQVAAVVGFAPPTDMEADTARRNGLSTSLKKLFGTTVMDDHVHELLKQMSAIDYVHPGLPPFLLIQGNADKSVMYPQTQAFAAKLKSLGVPCDFITIEQGPHDVTKWEKLDPDYKAKVIDWLKKTLK